MNKARRNIEVSFQEAAYLEEALHQYMTNNANGFSEKETIELSVLKGYVSYMTNLLFRDEAAAVRESLPEGSLGEAFVSAAEIA